MVNAWTCSACSKSLKLSSKYKHLKSIKHQKKLGIAPNIAKVKNPDTGRDIVVNGLTFRKLSKKYFYDEMNNEFIVHITNPKDSSSKLIRGDDKFNNYINHGYIYDKKQNQLINPSEKGEKAFGNGVVEYKLRIFDEHDPMKFLDKRIKYKLKHALEKLQGIKFNFRLSVTMVKNDGQEMEFHAIGKAISVTHEGDIEGSVDEQNSKILQQIDRFTMNGSGWVIKNITQQSILLINTNHRKERVI